ncbi:MAG: TylF/MycF/NovP-related O-methyltransferase [Ginsengibacter sp.]
MKKFIHKFYKKYIRNKIKGTLARQRLKFFLWDVYGYIPLLKTNVVSFRKKLLLLKKFVLVDWYVVHAHKPCELVPVILLILENANDSADANAAVVEAGCWLGGSSAKLSQACAVSGRQLHIYDSFAGVEPGDPSNREAHFFGTYVGAEEIVRRNVERFGDMAVCTFHKGWFIESFKNYDMKTGIVYIDCDLTKATMEVITAVQPHLLDGGKIFTQDYHISSVREALHDTKTWEMLHILPPKIQKLERNTASLNWDHV